jgi:cobalt/nickel transport system permease protein
LIQGGIIDFKRLELLAADNSAIHRLDARAKVLVTLLFIITVVSFGRYEVTGLLPFFIYPAVIVARAGLPPGLILKKIAIAIPFLLLVGAFNPLFDHGVVVCAGGYKIAGGWISCVSILVRGFLTVGAAVILVGVTGFPAICQALERLGTPKAFVVQLLFLYRYLFVLNEEAARAVQASELRSLNKRLGLRIYGFIAGNLLLRAWVRAENIGKAMYARGFSGEFHTRRFSRFGLREIAFVGVWFVLFICLRLRNGSELLGSLITRIFS